MIWYNLTQATRQIAQNKGFALLNIIGLAIGITAFLLIVFFVTDELRYDKFNAHHDRIFRVDTELKYGSISSYAIAAPPVAEAMLHSFPEVKHAVRIERVQNIQFKKGDQIIQEDRVIYADQSVFDVFSFMVLDGNIRNGLAGAGSLVITKSVAMKYFNGTKVSGKTIVIANDNSTHTIAAVVDDMPLQSHFHAEIFLPLSSQENSRSTNFNQFNFNTYVLLNDHQDAGPLSKKLDEFLKKHLRENMDVEAFEKEGNYIKLLLTPLDDIHLHSNKQRELEANADSAHIYIFTTIAALILALACVNFINLFTARSANRAKEVGIRKALGSVRVNIMTRFFLEALIMTVISVAIAAVTALACLPLLNALTGKNFQLSFTTLNSLFPIIVIVTAVVTFAAGFYPAFYLSSLHPVKVLKGELSSGFKRSKLRSVLVIAQFSIATFLVVGTLVMLEQLEFIKSKNIGYNRKEVLIINNVSSMNDAVVMKDEVKEISGVVNTCLSGYLPTGGARWTTNVSSESHEGLLTEFWVVDVDYVNTLEIELASGRNFSSSLSSDSLAIILNESASKMLNLGPNPLEKKIEAGGKTYTVIGIVRDFAFNSLRENVGPLVMALGTDWRSSLVVRISYGQIPNVLKQIKLKWEKLNPDREFNFSFMDKDFEALYVSEQRTKKLFTIFTALALIIGGLGLFGLSAYAAEQRTRELSIRKIVGASVGDIFKLLSFDFMKLIIISLMIAVPLAWWIMNQWLRGFATRISISISILLFSAALILLVAFATIAYQIFKAALKNPVDTLRSE